MAPSDSSGFDGAYVFDIESGRGCYVFRYLRKREAIYPMVIQRDWENGFS